MKYSRITLILIVSLSFSFCLRTRVVSYPDTPYSSTNPDDVKIYYKPPSAPFEIIGEVKSEGTSANSLGLIERYMRKRAATIGGDGIILINKKEQLGEAQTGSPSSNAFIYRNYIYYAYRPGNSKPMIRDQIMGLVIKWKSGIIKGEKAILSPKDANFYETLNPEREIKEAEELYLRGEYNKAIVKLKKLIISVNKAKQIINKEEILIKAKLLLGSCYMKMGLSKTAEAIFKEVLEYGPEIEINKGVYGTDVAQTFERLKEKKKEEKIEKKEQILVPIKKEIVEKRKKSYPKGFKIRVIKEGAVLRLKPNEEALIIKKLPVGGLLEALESIGEWIKIILLPDKDGIVITGYIHNSFIEFETKPVIIKPEKIITTPEKKFELAAKEIDKDYLSWKKDLARAKGKSSTGSILTITGGLVFVPCMVLTFVHMETKYEYGYWGLVQYEKKKVRTPYLIGDAIGLVALISGLAIHLPARGEVKKLENEGRRRGYIKAGLLPKYKAIGIQIGISF